MVFALTPYAECCATLLLEVPAMASKTHWEQYLLVQGLRTHRVSSSALSSGSRHNTHDGVESRTGQRKFMSQQVIDSSRASLVNRGRRLEYFTVAYNSLEGLIAIVSGLVAGSIALVGFGFDSVIEVTSGLALIWRLQADVHVEHRERVEMVALRIVGTCFWPSHSMWAMTRSGR